MNIPKLLRDETNTKITNKEEIINYINSDNNLEELKVYLSLLENQQKVDRSEVEEIINVLKNKLYNNNEFNYKYDLLSNDFDAFTGHTDYSFDNSFIFCIYYDDVKSFVVFIEFF